MRSSAVMMSNKITQWEKWWQAWSVVMLLGIVACSPSALVDVDAPSTVVDPATVNSAAGAEKLRAGALSRLIDVAAAGGYGGLLVKSGLLSDELTCALGSNCDQLDSRNVNESTGESQELQSARVTLHLAREALSKYAANSVTASHAWQGELYALEGYTVLWFAELYCSGIPLSTVPLEGAPVPSGGYTTKELFVRAALLFDSAMVLSGDSAIYKNLARVGKGRALLGLGQLAAADSAVASVETNFAYRLIPLAGNFQLGGSRISQYVAGARFRVRDNKGGSGLEWSNDPRTGVVQLAAGPAGFLWPAKYNVSPNGAFDPRTPYAGVPIRLADGLEARLIQAEAALARGDSAWLTILNHLRGACIGTTPCAPVPGLTSGSLPPLADPGTDTARISLLMKERAMWLYLTGHREGDLRRMVRLYHRDPNTLWATGIYMQTPFPSLGINGNSNYNGKPYGNAVVLPYRAGWETSANSLYQGCDNLLP